MALYAGLMSGTSMDGIDAALIEMPGNKLVWGITKKYSAALKERIERCIAVDSLSLAEFCQLNTLIGKEFADAVNELLSMAKVMPEDIIAIGSHGQTLAHNPRDAIPYTLQLGCGHTISELTQITVVADFRTRDLVNGGEAAPFAPLYHQELFSKANSDVAVVNIGGISNITFISSQTPTQGWDIGPGNCLMDAWIQRNQGNLYDKDGVWAQQGQIIAPLLTQLLADPFFKLAPPKSIGKEYYSLAWLGQYLRPDYEPASIQATLTAFTAHVIADAVLDSKREITALYLCGGGTHNKTLFHNLHTLLPKVAVKSVADLGVNPDYLEAMLFAWLAAQTINSQAVNLTKITGSKAPAILGAIYPFTKSY